jgi:apolipoprotein N-acyltransferase
LPQATHLTIYLGKLPSLAAGRRPDVLVNLTNDGWFWGSSELDMHLAAGIFRAVEVRTPLVIAANTGFSAAIDGSGRLLARGPRRAAAPLRVTVRPDGRPSFWLTAGTLPAGVTLAVMAVLALEWLATRRLAPVTGAGRQ